MKMPLLKSITLVSLIIAMPLFTSAEVINDESEVVSLYSKAKRMMRQQNWLEAISIFNELTGRFPNSPNLDLILFNKSKSEYYFGNYDKAIAGFSFFSKKYANSPNLAAAYFFIGNSYYKKGVSRNAVTFYMEAWKKASEEKLENIILNSLKSAFENAGTINFQTSHFANFPQGKICPVVKLLVNIHSKRGETEKIEELRDLCEFEIEIQNLKSKNKSSKNTLEIAVLLPLSGEMNSYAQEIYNGVVIAAEQIRQKNKIDLNITPYDTKGDPIETGRIVKQICKSYDTDLIIGPLTSQEASVASASLNCEYLPMIIPAATDAGLTLLSENSFQLSPNIELQGIRMAEYAINILNADTALIITPTSGEHLKMSAAFSDRFTMLGGEIISIEYYRPRDKDFGKIIRQVKATLLGRHPDSIFIVDKDGDTLDVEEIEAYVDCIFLPGAPERLRLLIPQISFYNLNSFFLGSDGWGAESVLKLEERYTRNAVFPSPFLSSGDSEQYLKFASLYEARYASRPTRLASLGYDALNICFLNVKRRRPDSEALLKSLNSKKQNAGVSGTIKFGRNRENIEMPIYKIERNQAINIDEAFDETEEGNSDE